MSLGIWELLLILAIVFVLFGAGKLPQVMNDIGKGIKSLKNGINDSKSNDKEQQKSSKKEDSDNKDNISN
jgi:sec-independent protein translocase protein TatA